MAATTISEPPNDGRHASGNGNHAPSWVPVLEQPLFTPRKLKIVCIGAGYSGLTLAYSLRENRMEEYVDLQIYEKNHDIGGTWLENRYPGVACDVPAHIYTFSFEPNPDLSSFYATGSEILNYMKRTATKYNLDRNIQLNTKVTDTTWDDRTNKWKVKAYFQGNVIEDEADILINAAGYLNKWKWPDIEGLHNFKGELMHSANWNENCDWKSKRVAVIGNGSSAIQIVPTIQPTAAKLVNYVRGPTWISTNFGADLARDGKNFQYSEEEKQRFRDKPETLLDLRCQLEHGFNGVFAAFQKDSPQQHGFREELKQVMAHRLNGDKELISKLVPDFSVGCRRLTPGDGYLEALQEDNARFDFNGILRVTETGIETEKGVEEFDIIVCATGFDVSFKPHWNLIGRNGKDLGSTWAVDTQAYMGICAPDMPNYFIFNGPNSPVGHGSLLATIQATAEYILRWTKKIATEDIKSVVVKSKALADFNAYSQEFLKRTVWASTCKSWYKDGKVDGNVVAMYAGSGIHFMEMLEHIRGEDFDIEYNSCNSFRFMGNGFTGREARGGDLAYYLPLRLVKIAGLCQEVKANLTAGDGHGRQFIDVIN